MWEEPNPQDLRAQQCLYQRSINIREGTSHSDRFEVRLQQNTATKPGPCHSFQVACTFFWALYLRAHIMDH